jgi:hypothetical protein
VVRPFDKLTVTTNGNKINDFDYPAVRPEP